MRALSLLPAVLTATTLLSPAPASQAVPAKRPRSVLFYLIDTCRGDRMGFDGYERRTTPFLDELAERSVVFEHCTSQASWTKPSMASMLTSQYPSSTGVYRMEQRLPEELLTWPEVLRRNGYYTAGFSANVVMGNTMSSLAQGFEYFVESTAINGGDPIRFASGSARKLNDHVLPWLEHTDHWPMLLYVHSVDPHEEYEPEDEYLERFADPEHHPRFREEWSQLLESRPPIPGLHVTQANFDATGIDSASFIAYASSLYDADISANDDQLELLWEALQADGWGDDLILVVTADHGEEFFDHGATSHGYSLYEEMTHVPLLIHAPGLLPAGKRVTQPVRLLDLFPTLCELLGISPPPGLAGESLVPLMRGAEAGERPIFSEHREDPVLRRIGQSPGPMTSLRRGRWKLILNEVGSQLQAKPRVELFDLETDPRELVDVADQHPEQVARLLPEVEGFIARRKAIAGDAESAPLDESSVAELRKLGYLGEDEEGASAPPSLWDALARKDLAAVRHSLEAGSNPNELEPATGVSPLAAAALAGDRELAALLLDAGVAVDVRSKDGSTPLSAAAFLGRVEVLELLLSRGADPAARSTQGTTALEATQAPWNITKFVADLLEIEIDREEIEAGRTHCAEILRRPSTAGHAPSPALFEALVEGDVAAAERALAAGASPNAPDARTGWTPLSTAAFHGRAEGARLLWRCGARSSERNKDLSTALHLAALAGGVEMIELLVEHEAEVDARDGRGSTPLHAAAFLGRAQATRALLDAGADPAAKDAAGLTPSDAAKVDWSLTEPLLRLLGLDLGRVELEAGRKECARILAGD